MHRADLHTHSTFSDGTLTPRQLAAAGAACGLKGMALTDHDTTEGLTEFHEAGRRLGLLTISGTELSLDFRGTTHMLGYRSRESGEKDLDLSFLQSFRAERNRQMFQKLVDLGLDLSWERVMEIAGGGQMGKPHLALALLEKGCTQTFQEAFARYIGKGMPAYVEKRRLTAQEGIRLLLESGYAPVLAHPGSLGLSHGECADALVLLKEWGLTGVEVCHPDIGPELASLLKEAAKKLSLVPTGGSDYHGGNKKHLSIAWVLENSPFGPGKLRELEEALKDAKRRLGLG
jgi:predicted metal-dependent phosphoesterase TrpH